jgi:hypothetical protein
MAPSGAFFLAALRSPAVRLGGAAGIKKIAIN